MRVICILLACTTATAAAGEDWYPSQHGEGDTLGAINHLSPDKVVEAAGLVKTGKTYALGVVTGWESPAYPPRHYAITVIQPGQDLGPTMGANRATGNDDLLYTWMGIGSQIDGLGHMGIDHVYYNGLNAKDFVTTKGLTALSIEKLPPMVGRGVLLDMTSHYGESPLPAGTAFNEAEIKAQAAAQDVQIRKGDIVLFHTGWLNLAGVDNERFMGWRAGPRHGRRQVPSESRRRGRRRGYLGTGSRAPREPRVDVPGPPRVAGKKRHLHPREHGRARIGGRTPDEGWEFLFVLGQPRFEGAVQAVINPVAIR